MKLVIDMNLSVAWSDGLRDGGYEAVHWQAVGAQDAPDEAIMEWARERGAVVLTRDLDFGIALTRQSRIAPSVIQIRAGRVTLPVFLPLVLRVLSEHRRALDTGALVTIEDERVRVGILDPDLPI